MPPSNNPAENFARALDQSNVANTPDGRALSAASHMLAGCWDRQMRNIANIFGGDGSSQNGDSDPFGFGGMLFGFLKRMTEQTLGGDAQRMQQLFDQALAADQPQPPQV